jgi:hypothetical protein
VTRQKKGAGHERRYPVYRCALRAAISGDHAFVLAIVASGIEGAQSDSGIEAIGRAVVDFFGHKNQAILSFRGKRKFHCVCVE